MLPVAPSAHHEDELDLRAYLTVLARRWKLLFLVVMVVVGAALAYTVQQDSRYRAESEILIRQNDSSTIVGDQTINAAELARQLNNELRLFESGTIEDAVEQVYEGPLDPEDVHASVVSDTADVLQAHVTATDPDEAATLVNLYVTTFLDVRRQQRVDELLAVGGQIQQKVDELNTRIQQADEEDVAALATQRAFYENQLEDLELSANITETSSAQILTEAEAPESPVSPKPVRDVALALVLGLVLGVGVAFLVDSLDERIRTVADLERVSGGLPVLALVPFVERGHTERFVATRDDASSPQAEAFRSLRTSVKFASLDRPIRVLQVTSPMQGSGKTTTVANLAVAFAQGGDRVAVACCDLRRPNIQERFGLSVAPGLTDVLADDAPLEQAIRVIAPNLAVLPAGTLPRNPSELLSAHRTENVIKALAGETEMVVLDSTPVLPVTDALVTSRMADATIVIVDTKGTTRKGLRRTLQLLAQVNAPVVGLVLNGATDSGQYGYSYGYAMSYDDQVKAARRAKAGDTQREARGRHTAPTG